MPNEPLHTTIDGRTLKLTNLQKVLYPEAEVVKAELIQYYINISEFILPFLNGRLMTFIRYPDGVNAHKFYSKNKPTWTPQWIASGKTSEDDDNEYIIINDQASLVWAANLASLELHPMTVRAERIDKPDFFIFDLDPPKTMDFEVVKDLALKLRPFLESYGYTPFVKTSGSKGLHIYVPIAPTSDQKSVVTAIKEISKEFVSFNPDTTLILNKEKRSGRVLLDIYRNNKSQTCAAPFSTRGRVGAPVSMPIRWEEVPELVSSMDYTILNALDYLKKGNPWEGFFKSRAIIHTKRKDSNLLPLQEYNVKREFKKTSEPVGEIQYGNNDQYVIQLHDASNLHYDLRLEIDGVLKSWAIPKGMPTALGTKRLAIATEAHPMKYLNFEGTIPAKEYGGGQMWIFESGHYNLISNKKDSIKFAIAGGTYEGTYIIYQTRSKQWIIEKKTGPDLTIHMDHTPMLASTISEVPSSSNYFYEIKWDGIRVSVIKLEDKVTIMSRGGKDITKNFPKIAEALRNIEPESAVIDGEIVVLDEDGKPHFSNVISRMHTKGDKSISNISKRVPATFYAFDMMYLDGKDIRKLPIEKRREWLKVNLNTGSYIRYSDSFSDGQQLYKAVLQHGLEGMMCKRKGATYISGRRTDHWVKLKPRIKDTALMIGYTKGQGDRSHLFGALHLAKMKEGKLQYLGKVGTGFDTTKLNKIFSILESLPSVEKPIPDQIDEVDRTIWIEARYQVEITYTSFTSNGTYREPVFVRLHQIEEE